MKNIYILPVLLLLSACASKPVPVKVEFPNAPQSLLKKCETLKQIPVKPGGTPITELLKTVVENYTLYHECSNKVDGWNEWYNSVKKIYDEAGR